jgi:hypothetical protein
MVICSYCNSEFKNARGLRTHHQHNPMCKAQFFFTSHRCQATSDSSHDDSAESDGSLDKMSAISYDAVTITGIQSNDGSITEDLANLSIDVSSGKNSIEPDDEPVVLDLDDGSMQASLKSGHKSDDDQSINAWLPPPPQNLTAKLPEPDIQDPQFFVETVALDDDDDVRPERRSSHMTGPSSPSTLAFSSQWRSHSSHVSSCFLIVGLLLMAFSNATM